MLVLSETTQAPGSCQCGSSLRMGKDARRRRVGTAPEFGRPIRAILDDDELDQRRGVEVEDQARCSETRSKRNRFPSLRRSRRTRLLRQSDKATTCKSIKGPLSEPAETGDGPATPGDDDLASALHALQVLTEAIMELTDSDFALKRCSVM